MDFDTVGSEDVSTDAENCMILSQALENIGLKRGTYLIKINNRKIVNGLLFHAGITDKDTETAVMRIIDKLDKIGIDEVAKELGKVECGIFGADMKVSLLNDGPVTIDLESENRK